MRQACVLLSTLFLVACGPDATWTEPGRDAGAALDAGTDGGDGGTAADSGTEDADAGAPGDAGTSDAGPGGDDGGTSPGADAGQPDAGPPACPADVTCLTGFPAGHDADTTTSPRWNLDHYSCAPNTSEAGPEVVYRVVVPTAGFLSAAVWEAPGVDVDVHLLSALDAQACLARGNKHAAADVTPGTYWVVVDSYAGLANAGAYHLEVGLTVPSRGACDLEVGTMPRVGDNGNHLAMPATGPVVKEAHLVTQEEPPPYPSTGTEFLARHHALSQARTGFVMYRAEPWAPLEGGSFYGCGIGSPTVFPVVDEAWYVNMYWTSAARPARSTRMILRVPGTSRAVVVSAGFETGPGDLTWVGGATEETHFYLRTASQPWTLGIAVDQSLPLGPRECL